MNNKIINVCWINSNINYFNKNNMKILKQLIYKMSNLVVKIDLSL